MAKKKDTTEGEDQVKKSRIEEVVELYRSKSKDAGEIILVGEEDFKKDLPVIPSGILSLDLALGVGGFPQGRIVELFGLESGGKTSVCLQAIAEAQKLGGIGAFIDAEHSLDLSYAGKLGVNCNNLLISRPDCGEEALSTVEHLAEVLGPGDIIVIDSVAALTPRSEINGEMGDQHMGLHARLMSQACRKLTSIISNSGVTVIFINQIRMKIGVMFGCFHYDTLLNFSDGSSIPIGKVVDEKIEGNVYSLKVNTREVESNPIIGWHDNGRVSKENEFIHIQTTSINGRGRFGLTCTPDHEILTVNGWKKAMNVTYEDKLVSKYKETVNGTVRDFLSGSLVGDSHVVASGKVGCIRFQDNKNSEYVAWKINKLKPFFSFTKIKNMRGFSYASDYSYEWAKIKKEIRHRDPTYMLKNYSHIGMAIWVMDDGRLDLNNGHCRYSISMGRLKNNMEKLEEVYNLINILGFGGVMIINEGLLKFNAKETKHLASCIAKYVPECMQYKLPKEYRGLYEEFELSNSPKWVEDSVEIKEIRVASNRQMRNKRKFDISVGSTGNYMVGGINNGVVVHNSPETTTGGGALKYFSSVRVDVRSSTAIKKNEEKIGVETKIKIAKNKVANPFKEVRVELIYGQGIPKANDILEHAILQNLVVKSGAHYSLANGEKIGQGKDNTIEFLKISPNVLEDLEKQLRKIYFGK